MNLAAKIASRYLLSRNLDREIQQHRLEGLLSGEPTVLYHGTTRSFRAFDMSKSRGELVDKFYGAGIFLTPSKRVAEKYANANRNIGFDPEIIDDLRQKNAMSGEFLARLVEIGDDAWEEAFDKIRSEGVEYLGPELESRLGVDPNSLGDLAGYIVGSKVKSSGGGDGPLNFFAPASTGAPDWLYDLLDDLGLDSTVYRPKVYTVSVQVENPLVTSSSSEAKRARTKGYDSVVFFGPKRIDDVPEVALFSSRNARILGVEIV